MSKLCLYIEVEERKECHCEQDAVDEMNIRLEITDMHYKFNEIVICPHCKPEIVPVTGTTIFKIVKFVRDME